MLWPSVTSPLKLAVIAQLVTAMCVLSGHFSSAFAAESAGLTPAIQEGSGQLKAGFISPPAKLPRMVLPETQPEESPEAFEARIQKHIVPRSFLYQQAVFARYPRYRQKIVPLLESLDTLAVYLKGLDETEAPDVQLLSAKANLLELQWENLARDIEPHEAEYRSYAHLTEAVAGVTNIADYWVKADKHRGQIRPTIGAMADDITYWAEMRQVVLREIAALDEWRENEKAIQHPATHLPPRPFP